MVYMGREGQCIWQQTCKCVRVAEDIGCVRDKGLHWFSSDSCRDRALYLRRRCAVQSATFTKNNSPSTGLRLKEKLNVQTVFPVFHAYIFPAFHSSLSVGIRCELRWLQRGWLTPQRSCRTWTKHHCFHVLHPPDYHDYRDEHRTCLCFTLKRGCPLCNLCMCIFMFGYICQTHQLDPLRESIVQYKGFFSIQSFFHIFCLSK